MSVIEFLFCLPEHDLFSCSADCDGVESAQFEGTMMNRPDWHGATLQDLDLINDDQDRLLIYDASTFTYTDNGELLTKTENGQTTSYTYDEHHQEFPARTSDFNRLLVNSSNEIIVFCK
ncbi:RHS repeat protein [bacterium]|nr:RHS repeat protein [bacterium]